jgi:hypothetical protein
LHFFRRFQTCLQVGYPSAYFRPIKVVSGMNPVNHSLPIHLRIIGTKELFNMMTQCYRNVNSWALNGENSIFFTFPFMANLHPNPAFF